MPDHIRLSDSKRIFWTQDSIERKFQDGRVLCEVLVDALTSSASLYKLLRSLTPLDLITGDRTLASCDNRRLCILKTPWAYISKHKQTLGDGKDAPEALNPRTLKNATIAVRWNRFEGGLVGIPFTRDAELRRQSPTFV